jgi:hypothetical protein
MTYVTGSNDPIYKAVRQELMGFQINHAAKFDNFSNLKELVAAGASVNCENRLKQTPLILAAGNGSLETVRWLIEQDADIAHKDVDGKMAIHYAVLESNPNLVRLLLTRGAVVEAKDNYGESAWNIANTRGSSEIRQLLKYRPLIRGPRLYPTTKPRPQLSLSPQLSHTPHSNEARRSTLAFEATIIDSFDIDGQEFYFRAHPSLYDVVYGQSPSKILKQHRAREYKNLLPKLSWCHLPSNNVSAANRALYACPLLTRKQPTWIEVCDP